MHKHKLRTRRIPAFIIATAVSPLGRSKPILAQAYPERKFVIAQVALQKRTVQVPFIAERIRIPITFTPAKFRNGKAFLNVISMDRERHRERIHVLRRVCSHKPSERTPTRATDVF